MSERAIATALEELERQGQRQRRARLRSGPGVERHYLWLRRQHQPKDDLVDIDFASASEGYAGSNASGRLTVSDSSGDSVTLNFAGKYTSASFALKNDGFGGTLITDPPAAANPYVRSASLFGSYIASSFVAAPGAFGGSLITALMAAEMPLVAHPAP